MDPYMNDATGSQFYNVPTSAHCTAAGQRRSSSPARDQRSYSLPYSNQFSVRGQPYPFYSGLPGIYPPHRKESDQMVESQYQSPLSRPPDNFNVARSVEVTRAGPVQALSSIVPSPTSQIITSHVVHRSEMATPRASSSGPLQHYPNVRPSSKPRSGSSRGSPRATPSLIKAEAPTTLGASMSGSDCFSTAEEPIPYALTNHPIFSEDLKKACTPIRKVENPFATHKKTSNAQSVYGEYEIQRYRNDVLTSKVSGSSHPSSKLGIQPYPNGVKDPSSGRSEYPVGASSSNVQDRQGGALDLSLKTVRQSADSTAPELDSLFSNSAPYLGKGSFETTKQTMPYDYSCRHPSVKRHSDEIDRNAVRNKFQKVNPSQNHVLARHLEIARGSHVTSRFGLGKNADHCDTRPACDANSFAQAHTSLIMPYGRQVQSANSSGYFSEGISEPGVSFTPPVSPRIKHPPRLQEKDREPKVEAESYHPHVRPTVKNSPYNAYCGQYSNVYDRGRHDDTLKLNSQNSYNNSAHGYYQGYSLDRYQNSELVNDSIPYLPSSCTYGKTTEPVATARRSYDSFLKQNNPEQQYVNQNTQYRQYFKQETKKPRVEAKRQPKIEIASQPINLVEDNEISIEKTQNNSLPFDDFSHRKELSCETDSFQSSAEVIVGSEEGKDATARSTSNTPSNKVNSTQSIEKMVVGGYIDKEVVGSKINTMGINNSKITTDRPVTCDISKDSCQKLTSIVERREQPEIKDESIKCHATQNVSDTVRESGKSPSITGGTKASTVSNNYKNIDESSKISSSSDLKSSCNVSKGSSTIGKSHGNVPSLISNELDMVKKIKQEQGHIKCEPGLREINQSDSIAGKTPDIAGPSKNKVNFADVNSLKEFSVSKNDTNLAQVSIPHHSTPQYSNLNYKKLEVVQPVLNLSLSANQGGANSCKSVEVTPPMCMSSDNIYKSLQVNNYYNAKLQPLTNVQQNNCNSQNSHINQLIPLNSEATIDKAKHGHPAYSSDGVAYEMKHGMKYHKNFHHLQPVFKTEGYSDQRQPPVQGYPSHVLPKNEYETMVTSSNQFNRNTKEVNCYPVADTVTDKTSPLKQTPLAINPRVLSPWNSSVPHSLTPNIRKPSGATTSQPSNDSLREASPLVKEILECEKKLRLTPTYQHDPFANQYPYISSEVSYSSSNSQPERSHTYSSDNKSITYPPLAHAYTPETHSYQSYDTTATLNNVASVSHQFNSSSSIGNRPLLSPHSPSHPPPPRLESSHHQALYYPTTYNASISPRTIGDQYPRASPHYATSGDAKYQSREYPSYTYKGAYGQQDTTERIPYSTPSYYSHQPYNTVSSSQTSHQDFSKSGRFNYPNEQQGYAKFGQESSYMQERQTYPHPSVYSCSSGPASKEFPSDKSPSLPPAAHLPQSSVQYKPTSYDNLQQMHTSPQNSMLYNNQYPDHKGYLHAGKGSSHPNQMISSSYPYSTPKNSYQGFEHLVDTSSMRAEYDTGQYSLYPHSYDRSSSALNKQQHRPINQNISYGETSIPKIPQHHSVLSEMEIKTEKPSAIVRKPNTSYSLVDLKNNIGKPIYNPAQPLYNTWPNYRPPHPDTTLNKQLPKSRSVETSLSSPSQKYPSFKTEKETVNQHSKSYHNLTTLSVGAQQAIVSNRNGMPLKEKMPFSRQEHYIKGVSPSTSLPNDTKLKESKISLTKQPSSADLDFDRAMSIFEGDLGTNREGITSKKSLILDKRYSNRVELQKSADLSGALEEDVVESVDESESEAEPPCKFRGKYKTIKGKKSERIVLTYASHSEDSATEMIADEDESDFEEELVREIRAKARKGRGKDKEDIYKDTPDDSDVSSADCNERLSKHKKDASRHMKETSSSNSTDTSCDSSDDSNSSESSARSRVKKKVSEMSSSECETRETRNTRSKGDDSKKFSEDGRKNLKRSTRRRLRRTFHNLSDLSEDEVKPKRLRSTAKGYSSNSDTFISSPDCDSRVGREKGRRLLLESDSDSEKNSTASEVKDTPSLNDPILKKLDRQRKLESTRSDVIEMKAWKKKTCEQAKALLKSLPMISMKHSWKRPLFSGVFKKGWQAELRKFKLETARTPKQLISVPPTPVNVDRRRGRKTAKGRGRAKETRDCLYSKAMMRRFFDKVLHNRKEDESLSRGSSSPFSTFTPTGLTPTPSVSPSMLVTGIGSGDSDKDSLISLRGASPPASDSATLRRRSIATTIIQKIQRQQYKDRGLEAPWLTKPRPILKAKSSLPISKSPCTNEASGSKKPFDVAFIRSVFGEDPPPNFKSSSGEHFSKAAKRNKYFLPLSSSTLSTSSTPSTPVDADEIGGVVTSRKRKLKKFRSGFDYIPKKKKKLKPLEEVGSRVRKKVAARRRRVWPENSRDVATEVKTWVINKGLGESVLHRAARLQYHDIVIYCLEGKEINVNARDNAGYTPLHEACNRGHLDVAQALCAFGAQVNAPGYGGMRPLHEACDNGHLQLVRLLLSFGADINLASYAGQSCISLDGDSVCGPFVLDFINDMRGKKAKPWTFEGPARLFDLTEEGASIFADVPTQKDDDEDAENFLFETSQFLLPYIYFIEGFPGSFVILKELLDSLNVSYNELVKEAGQIETVYLSRKDFMKRAHCSAVVRGSDHNLKNNTEIVLVKYTKRLKNMLGVEVVTVT